MSEDSSGGCEKSKDHRASRFYSSDQRQSRYHRSSSSKHRRRSRSQDKSKIKDKSKKKFDNKTSKIHESSPRGSTDSEDVGHSGVKGITNSSHIKFSPNLRSNHALSNLT